MSTPDPQTGTESPLLLREGDVITTLTLNRPRQYNSLSEDLLAELQENLDSIAADEKVRVVILAGSGKAFCAGHDLKEMRARPDKAYQKELFQTCSRMMLSLLNLPQPVIAKVHGIATAAGCQLVASCDLALAAQSTRFGVNGVDIGLFCSTPMVALSRNVSRKQAFEMLITGDFIQADRAAQLGLINRAVPDAELAAETAALAEKIAAKLGSAVNIGKRAFYEQLQMPLDQAYIHSGRAMVENMLNSDTAEGIAAFIEKREPEWRQ